MQRIELIVDVVSTVAAFGALYSIAAPWWAYLVVLSFGIAQKWLGLHQGRQEFARKALTVAVARVRQHLAEREKSE